MVCMQQHLGTLVYSTLLSTLLSCSHTTARLTSCVHMMAHSEQGARAALSPAVREGCLTGNSPHGTHLCKTCKDAEDGRQNLTGQVKVHGKAKALPAECCMH